VGAGRLKPAAPAWLGPAALGGAGLMRLLGATWRIERVGTDARAGRLPEGGACIYALWHARLLPLTFAHRGQGVAALISRHRDGELIARLVERLGYVTARGSSTRGGGEGAREMLTYAASGHSLTVTPDGPRGPAEVVKPGLVYLASRSGLPVLPVSASARRTWRLRSWDGFRVPQPFARLVVGYGEPIRVPAGLDGEALEPWRRRIEEALVKITAETVRRAGEVA
jgi:lysophospholipid acyltransferase (LPLAT)-like uncharacterized protein